MKAESRIYTVTDGKKDRLVRAMTRAQALRHVAVDVFKTRVATQDDIICHLSANLKIEDATSDGQVDMFEGTPDDPAFNEVGERETPPSAPAAAVEAAINREPAPEPPVHPLMPDTYFSEQSLQTQDHPIIANERGEFAP